MRFIKFYSSCLGARTGAGAARTGRLRYIVYMCTKCSHFAVQQIIHNNFLFGRRGGGVKDEKNLVRWERSFTKRFCHRTLTLGKQQICLCKSLFIKRQKKKNRRPAEYKYTNTSKMNKDKKFLHVLGIRKYKIKTYQPIEDRKGRKTGYLKLKHNIRQKKQTCNDYLTL